MPWPRYSGLSSRLVLRLRGSGGGKAGGDVVAGEGVVCGGGVVFIKAPFRAPLTGSPPSVDASRLQPRSDWAYSLRPETRWEKQGPVRNPKSPAKIKPGGGWR